MKRVYFVCGTIGAGKSTVLEHLGLCTDRLNCRVVPEPITEWGQLLDDMYASRLDTCAFQLMALTTRFAALDAALKGPEDILIVERSLEEDRHIFARQLLAPGSAEMRAYTLAWDALQRCMTPHTPIYIFLDASADLAMSRIRSRGRAAEMSITKQYVEDLNVRYREWVATVPSGQTMIVDASKSPQHACALVADFILH